MGPIATERNDISFGDSTGEERTRFSDGFERATPCPLFGVGSSVPLQETYQDYFSKRNEKGSIPIKFSNRVATGSHSGEHDHLEEYPLPSRARSTPNDEGKPSPPTEQTIGANEPISHTIEQTSSSSYSDGPSYRT